MQPSPETPPILHLPSSLVEASPFNLQFQKYDTDSQYNLEHTDPFSDVTEDMDEREEHLRARLRQTKTQLANLRHSAETHLATTHSLSPDRVRISSVNQRPGGRPSSYLYATKDAKVLVATPCDQKWRNAIVPASVFYGRENDHVGCITDWFNGSEASNRNKAGVLNIGGPWWMWYVHTDRVKDEQYYDWSESTSRAPGNRLAANLIGDHFEPCGFNPLDRTVVFAKIGKNGKLMATTLSAMQKLHQISRLFERETSQDRAASYDVLAPEDMPTISFEASPILRRVKSEPYKHRCDGPPIGEKMFSTLDPVASPQTWVDQLKDIEDGLFTLQT